MDGLIKYEKAQELDNFGLPKDCPRCNKMWKPELHIITVQEGFWGETRMAQLYTKQCEFCGYIHRYYA